MGLKLGGCGTVVVLIGALVVWALGGDPSALLGAVTGSGDSSGVAPGPSAPAEDDPQVQFVSAVLGDTEETWHQLFQQRGQRYVEPRLVLFTDAVASACGYNSSAVGPFYCPPDQQVYIDLSFFHELDRHFGAPGDFAAAYVIAHEVGHHVQTLTGVSADVRARSRGLPEDAKNELSVRQELQADCYAGVWAHHAETQRDLLEAGDVEEALRAAAAIGDDTLQRRAQGHVVPETFTHGTSEQRARWFRRGLSEGRMEACDTFQVAPP